MKVYKEKYVAYAYRKILGDLLNNPEYISIPRGMEVREIINCVIEIEEPNKNMYKNKIRSSQETYVSAELLWYFSGTNNIGFIGKHAQMWKQLANEKNEVNSAYGNLIFCETNTHGLSQYEWAIESLRRDKDSRQAFMHFNKPEHQYFGNKDQVCTLIALFHIRNDKLLMTLTMRSNDIILGFMTDFTFFNILHQQVYLQLKEFYPELKMGRYTHTSHSMHLYARHYDLVEKMLQTPFFPHKTPPLNTSITDNSGIYLDKYSDIFDAIQNNTEVPTDKTDNDILNWAIELQQ